MNIPGPSRRTRRNRVYVVAGIGLAVVVATAGVAPAADPPEFAQRRVFFHCGPARVSNLDVTNLPSWNETAPSQALGASGGCASGDPASANFGTGARDDAVWEGRFTGNLNSFTVEGYVATVGPGEQTSQISVRPFLTIDGATVNLTPLSASIAVSPGPDPAVDVVRFTVSGLNLVEDLDNDGKPDSGPGTTQRTVRVRLASWVVTTTVASVWLFDATNVPAGITFNPQAAAASVFAKA